MASNAICSVCFRNDAVTACSWCKDYYCNSCDTTCHTELCSQKANEGGYIGDLPLVDATIGYSSKEILNGQNQIGYVAKEKRPAFDQNLGQKEDKVTGETKDTSECNNTINEHNLVGENNWTKELLLFESIEGHVKSRDWELFKQPSGLGDVLSSSFSVIDNPIHHSQDDIPIFLDCPDFDVADIEADAAMAVHTNTSYSDYCYASFEPRPLALDDNNDRSDNRRDFQGNRRHGEYEECRPDNDVVPLYSSESSDIYDSPIIPSDKNIPEYAVVNKSRKDLYDSVADPVGDVSAEDLYAVVDKSKKHQKRYTNPENHMINGGKEGDPERFHHTLSDSQAHFNRHTSEDLYEDPDALGSPVSGLVDGKGIAKTSPVQERTETMERLDSGYSEGGKIVRKSSKQRSQRDNRNTERSNDVFTVATAQEQGYAFHSGMELLDINHDIKRERGSKKKKGMKSQFFVAIPERKGETPPTKPKPFSEGRWGLSRKMSLPVSSAQNEQDTPSEIEVSNKMREKLNSQGRHALSLEDLLGSYVDVKDDYATVEHSGVILKGHRRNLSHDGFSFKRNSIDVSTLNSNVKQSVLNATKKQVHRMGSHDNVNKIFSSTPHGSHSDLTTTERDSSPQSGKASVESNVSSESSMSVPSKSSRGSVDSADSTDIDMRQLLQQAEELVSDELPEGWQEVRDGGETYYWHIWTGTIQYERPMLSTSSSSRSVSPMSSQDSCPSTNTSANDLRGAQSKSPQPLSRPESPPSGLKQAISFPVHSMGWMEVEEDKMSASCLGDTVNHCITTLAGQRNDLWHTGRTWGEGKDIKLILEGEVLKLYEPREKVVMLNQPIAKMRVWGVGKEEQRDFAYIARDPKSGKHKCHMFRCHGHMSGRSITNALHSICNRVLEEKRKAKERASPSVKTGSDLLHAPVPQTAKDSSGFNEKPFLEQKKSFTAKYVGCTEVSRPSGIETLNKAVAKLTTGVNSSSWRSVLVDITTSEIRTIDCSNQAILMEDRVRFVSFLGIAKDEKMCGYIVAVGQDSFMCHVFMCAPHAGILTKAIEEACRLRYEKVLDRRASEGRRVSDPQLNSNHQKSIMKEKGLAIKSSMQELFHKFQKRDGRRRASKQDEGSQTSPENKSPPLQPGVNEHMIKYFGCVQVTIGTGNETVQHSVEKALSGGSMMVGYLEVTMDTLTLYDSQRTNLSRRVIDLDTVSYCGMTSDSKHFGIIVTQGRGKYVCHVFQEYKTPVDQVVKAIMM